MSMLIDTHGHVNFHAFQKDATEVLARTLKEGTWVVMPGTQYETSKRAVVLAEQYSQGVYAAVGIHPIHLSGSREVDELEVQSAGGSARQFATKGEDFDYAKYKELAQSKKVVAIGEVGLDYYYQPKGRARREEYRSKQKETLREQFQLALELNLPAIIHCRVAHGDLYDLLTEYKGKLRGVSHCYTGTKEEAEKFLGLGLFLGFSGLILKQVASLPDPAEVIASLPMERILLETDAPYLTPPGALTERNEPLCVRYVAEFVAKAKGVSLEEVAEQTTKNAKALFGI